MCECKKCKSTNTTKNGIVRKKQRYYCKECGYNFIIGDKRTNDNVKAKKALAVMMYSLGKGSLRGIAHILGVSHTLVLSWIKEAANSLPAPEISENITEIEFDEMWHFIKSKKTNCGL